MNLIVGKVRWDVPAAKTSTLDPIFNNGRLELRVTRFKNQKHDGRNYHYAPAKEIFCTVLGQITNLKVLGCQYLTGSDSDLEIIEKLYEVKGTRFIEELDGTFLVMIADMRRKKCFVFQPWAGFSLPVYYSFGKEYFDFSTNLKELLENLPYPPQLSMEAVRDFLHYGLMIPNKLTLIKGVDKLVPGNYLEIDIEQRFFKVFSCKTKEPKISSHYAKQHLVDSVEWCIESLIGQLKDDSPTLTITGGWDCNVILHYLRKHIDAPLKAVTVSGSGVAPDETVSAKRILEHYQNVEHITGAVTKSTFFSLPDMVSRCEGYFFEEGMFLRYELGRILEKAGCKSIFMGVGADQILFPESAFKKTLRTIWNMIKNYRKGLWRPGRGSRLANKYAVYIDWNLKMHGIMMNSFGIEGYYPFLNLATSSMAKAVGFWCSFRKKLYKQKVAKILAPSILEYIKKSSMVTDIKGFFLENKNLFLCVVKSSFVRNILTEAEIDKLLEAPARHYMLICQLAYLYLFNEIFVKRQSVLEVEKTFCEEKIS